MKGDRLIPGRRSWRCRLFGHKWGPWMEWWTKHPRGPDTSDQMMRECRRCAAWQWTYSKISLSK